MKRSGAGTSTCVLGVMCFALLGVLLAILDSGADPVYAPPIPAPAAQAPQTAPGTPDPPPSLQSHSAIWLKPLFSPGRSPDPTPAPQVATNSGLTLTGVVITEKWRVALFRQHGSTVIVGKEHQPLFEGWSVVRIDPRSVQLARGAEQLTVSLPPPGAPPTPRTADPPVAPQAFSP
jgi:general secretion pathway protein N